MTFDFAGQTAIVTGGTRGIGRQIASDLAHLGASVVAVGADPARVAALNREGTDERIRFVAVDFIDRAATERFADEIAAYERLDVLVNNAGINRINRLADCRLDDWDALMRVNLEAPFLLLRAATPVMQRTRYGRIVNIGSVFGLVSRVKRSTYSTTKFGLHGLTVAVSNELAADNVLVNVVSPGFVMTELTERMLTPAERDELTGQIPARRFATPADISRVVVFLCSSLNTYVTGQNVVVDGGFVNV